MKAHSAEKQLKKSLILREKRLDYLGSVMMKVVFGYINIVKTN